MHFPKLRTLVVVLIVLGLVSNSLQRRRRVVDCIKYPLAPVCRGVGAKRSLTSLPSSMGDSKESTPFDFDTYGPWKDEDKGLGEKKLVRLMLKKLEPEAADYENENLENY